MQRSKDLFLHEQESENISFATCEGDEESWAYWYALELHRKAENAATEEDTINALLELCEHRRTYASLFCNLAF